MITDGSDEPSGRPSVIFDPPKPKTSAIAGQECQRITGKLPWVDCETVRYEPLHRRDIDRGIRSNPGAELRYLF